MTKSVRRAAGTTLATTLLATFIPGTVATAQPAAPSKKREAASEGRSFPTSRIRIPAWRLTDGLQVRSAFRETVAAARPATVRILADERNTALGVIVGADGWIVTKASQLTGAITCQLADRRELKAQIVGVDREYDIALLKVAAQGLTVLQLDAESEPQLGAWLATVGMKPGPLAVGVVSVESREIDRRFGVLGVAFDEGTERPIIEQVFSDTAAAEAGLKEQDELLGINDEQVESRITFIKRVREFSPGDRISLRVRRAGETLTVDALLKGRRPWLMPSREDFQNQLGSSLSRRRFGFPRAFQHDTVVKPTDCGGPVVNLDGEVVGLNIARAGRTETYAIPTKTLVDVIKALKPNSS